MGDGLNIDDQSPYEDQKQFEEEDDELANYDLNKDLEIPKMVRKNSANIYTARVVRMFNKKLQDWCRFSGLTGVRTVSDELDDSSYFDADSDQTLHSHESRKYRGAAYNPMEMDDGYVRLDSNGDQEVETELRRLRSSVQQFINPTAPA